MLDLPLSRKVSQPQFHRKERQLEQNFVIDLRKKKELKFRLMHVRQQQNWSVITSMYQENIPLMVSLLAGGRPRVKIKLA